MWTAKRGAFSFHPLRVASRCQGFCGSLLDPNLPKKLSRKKQLLAGLINGFAVPILKLLCLEGMRTRNLLLGKLIRLLRMPQTKQYKRNPMVH